jgi:hypothetical protein
MVPVGRQAIGVDTPSIAAPLDLLLVLIVVRLAERRPVRPIRNRVRSPLCGMT